MAGGLVACGDSSDDEATDDTSSEQTPPPVHNAVEGSSEVGAGPLLGSVLSWANNGYSQLGNGTGCNLNTGANCTQPAPGPVVGLGGQGQLTQTLALSAGGFHTLALQRDRTVLAWGYNEQGQLGDGGTGGDGSPQPVAVSGPGGTGQLTAVTALGGGGLHSLAVAQAAKVWAWGTNIWGQLGVGTTDGPDNCAASAAGPPAGQPAVRALTGSPANVCSKTPAAVVGPDGTGQLTGATAVVGGDNHSLALMADRTVMAWGLNEEGQLGIGSSQGPESCRPYSNYDASGCSTKPVPVVGPDGTGKLDRVLAVTAGEDFNLALRTDGTVWAWGTDRFTDLGQVDPALLEQCQSPFFPAPVRCSTKPIQVVGPGGQGFLTDVKAIAAEGSVLGLHAMALRSDGTVWSWGVNDLGQLGRGTSTEYETAPGQVVGPGGEGQLTDVVSIAVGGKFSLALKSDGSVWGWGGNDQGQLGIGANTGPEQCTTDNTPCSLTPVQAHGQGGQGLLTGVAALVAGDTHSVAGVKT
jgi:alpha-tubulin suppressor-like RCC1 family protein